MTHSNDSSRLDRMEAILEQLLQRELECDRPYNVRRDLEQREKKRSPLLSATPR